MDIDPDNPVVKLCARGMKAESAGRLDEARQLFEQAWSEHDDDYEACIAAHYLARHQETPRDLLHWNQTALDHAERVGDGRVTGFYPSLYLNLGNAHEQLGDHREAARCYRLGEQHAGTLAAGPYGDMVRGAIARGHQRVARLDL
jgi:hypothetical protein